MSSVKPMSLKVYEYDLAGVPDDGKISLVLVGVAAAVPSGLNVSIGLLTCTNSL